MVLENLNKNGVKVPGVGKLERRARARARLVQRHATYFQHRVALVKALADSGDAGNVENNGVVLFLVVELLQQLRLELGRLGKRAQHGTDGVLREKGGTAGQLRWTAATQGNTRPPTQAPYLFAADGARHALERFA